VSDDEATQSAGRWLLLVYTLPAQPTRLRAAVWRDLKAGGALYLHDGVGVLPDAPESRMVFESLAVRVREFGGESTLVAGVLLDAGREGDLRERFATVRGAEYGELRRECRKFQEHLRREADHYEFTYEELEELAEELEKVRRWGEKVRARDYLGHRGAAELAADLHACEEALAEFGGQAFAREHGELAGAGDPTRAERAVDSAVRPAGQEA
jgi:hypothetical protein